MTQTFDELPTFDVLSLSSVDDPYALFAEWRAAGPLMNGVYGWGVTRHADVAALLRDRRVGHSFPRDMMRYATGDGPFLDFQMHSILNQDGDAHTRVRRLIGQAFSAPLVRRLQSHIATLTDASLDRVLDGQVCDAVDDLAYPLPSAVICELLGLPVADRDVVRGHAERMVSPDTNVTDVEVLWFREYIEAALRDRTPDPDGDLLSSMLAAGERDDRLTHEEIVDHAVFLFFAGFETTRHLIASGVAALLDFPDQTARLLAEPALAKPAVEEFLRYDPPLRTVPRITFEPITIGDRTIKAGRFLQLLVGSANRDERVFADADRLDIARSPNPHLSFAAGVHHCLGAVLARLEATVVFERIAARVAALEPAGQRRRVTATVGTYASVPIRVRAR
ncbi:MAG TPA: cytochrome P450 [Acidimicrobiales bacterium]|nr:cytochrome P450 [Acidimicrobiales bacterium]